jgi:hypothetical protein
MQMTHGLYETAAKPGHNNSQTGFCTTIHLILWPFNRLVKYKNPEEFSADHSGETKFY